MRAIIRNSPYWSTLGHSTAAHPLRTHCRYENRGGQVEGGTLAVTAAAAAAIFAAAATTAAAVFCFQEDNRRRQDGA